MNKYLKDLYEDNIKKMNCIYFEMLERFLSFLIQNELEIEDFKKLNKKKLEKLNLKKSENAIYIMINKNEFIEISLNLKNSFKKEMINLKEYGLIPLKEGEIQDISYIKDNNILLYTSETKDLLYQKNNFKFLYSPNKADWELSTEIDGFYNKLKIKNYPKPQFNFLKENENNSLISYITFLSGKDFEIEYYKNLEDKEPKIINHYKINKKGIKIPI